MTARQTPSSIDSFPHHRRLTTRWHDNDIYGHVNNVVYYAFFDTAVNQFLIERRVLDPVSSTAIGVVVETQCRYFAAIAFPDIVTAGLRVTRIGDSSVRYEVGIFKNDDAACSAEGHFIHVYVDRNSRRPVAIPADVRAALASILV
jgi:acyl-CoA thioester hydrolase